MARVSAARAVRLATVAVSVVVALSGFVWLGSAERPLIALLWAFTASLVAAALARGRLRVGSDGLWHAGLGPPRFVGYEAIRGVTAAGLTLRVHLAHEDVDLPAPLVWGGAVGPLAARAVASRVWAATTARTEAPAPAPDAAHGRPFRAAPPRLSELSRSVATAAQPPRARIDAARALLRVAPERAPLLVELARGCASPALGRALLGVSGGDEPAVARALAEAEAEAVSPARHRARESEAPQPRGRDRHGV